MFDRNVGLRRGPSYSLPLDRTPVYYRWRGWWTSKDGLVPNRTVCNKYFENRTRVPLGPLVSLFIYLLKFVSTRIPVFPPDVPNKKNPRTYKIVGRQSTGEKGGEGREDYNDTTLKYNRSCVTKHSDKCWVHNNQTHSLSLRGRGLINLTFI